MTFQKRLRGLGRKRPHEAVVGMRQIHGQVMRLLLDAGNHHQRFAEIRLRLAGRVHQRHKHLLTAQRRRAHVVLHDRVAAWELMFFF